RTGARPGRRTPGSPSSRRPPGPAPARRAPAPCPRPRRPPPRCPRRRSRGGTAASRDRRSASPAGRTPRPAGRRAAARRGSGAPPGPRPVPRGRRPRRPRRSGPAHGGRGSRRRRSADAPRRPWVLPGSAGAEAERVPRRVRVNPEGPRAVLGVQRTGTQRQHLLLGGVQVLDLQVEVELLRVVGRGPPRRHVARGALEGEERAAGHLDLHPVALAVGGAADHVGVETGQGARGRTVQDDGAHLGNGHASSSGVTSIREQPVTVTACSRIAGNLADRKSTRLNSSHVKISYAVFCLKKKKEAKISN